MGRGTRSSPDAQVAHIGGEQIRRRLRSESAARPDWLDVPDPVTAAAGFLPGRAVQATRNYFDGRVVTGNALEITSYDPASGMFTLRADQAGSGPIQVDARTLRGHFRAGIKMHGEASEQKVTEFLTHRSPWMFTAEHLALLDALPIATDQGRELCPEHEALYTLGLIDWDTEAGMYVPGPRFDVFLRLR